MGVRDILKRTRRPEHVPDITATQAKIISDTQGIVAEGLHPQEAFWPRQAAQLEQLRAARLMRPLDPGENPLCSTEITSLGCRALDRYELENDRADD